MTPVDGSDHYECDGCGACCRTYIVLVSVEDAAREPRIAAEARLLAEHEATPHWQYQLFPLPFHEACCFLGGDNRCTIYETRPRVCREFPAGSERCQDARRCVGLGPLIMSGGVTVTLTIAGKRTISSAIREENNT